jgi:hypothetical protein
MGLIRSLFSFLFGGADEVRALGQTVQGVAEVFRPNATRAMELGHDAYMAAHASHESEFQYARAGWFDTFVNGLNRLPRPLLALGTLALFIFAMAAPDPFAMRMRGLAEVPDPLWWLLGAVVAFYFGARETHHLRLAADQRRQVLPPFAPAGTQITAPTIAQDVAVSPEADPELNRASNPALGEWLAAQPG